MTVVLGSNIASLKAQRSLSRGGEAFERSLERLASGQRINRASDDAAGLAVASSLNFRAHVNSRAILNLNDGLSYTSIASAATDQLKSIVFRIKELATQSANGTLDDNQRKALEVENVELRKEYERILSTTQFNGEGIFKRSSEKIVFQAGIGSDATLAVNIGDVSLTTKPDGTFQAPIPTGFSNFSGFSSGVLTADLNGDGILDIVDQGYAGAHFAALGNGDGTFRAPISGGGSEIGLALADFDNDGLVDILTADANNPFVRVFSGNGDGTFVLGTTIPNSGARFAAGDINQDGNIDIIAMENASYYTVSLGDGTGNFAAPISTALAISATQQQLVDATGDGVLDFVVNDVTSTVSYVLRGNGNGTFSAAVSLPGASAGSFADFNSDGNIDFAGKGSTFGTFSISFGNGDGTFASPVGATVGVYGNSNIGNSVARDFDGDGILDLAVSDTTEQTVVLLRGNGDGTFKPQTSVPSNGTSGFLVAGDLNGDGADDLITAESVLLAGGIRSYESSLVGILDSVTVETRSGALSGMDVLNRAFEKINEVSSTIGAFESRVRTAINNTQVSVEATQAAASRILDVDVASEGAENVRSRILQQIASSILSQANVQPRLALDLLRG